MESGLKNWTVELTYTDIVAEFQWEGLNTGQLVPG